MLTAPGAVDKILQPQQTQRDHCRSEHARIWRIPSVLAPRILAED